MNRLIAALAILAWSSPAVAQTYISDSFTAPDYTSFNGHAPDTSLTGAVWTTVGSAAGCPRLVVGVMQPACVDNGTFTNLGYINSGLSDAVVGVDWTPYPGGSYWGYAMGGLLVRYVDPNNYIQIGF